MRPTILALAISLGAASVAHAQAVTWLVPQAAGACDEVVKLPKVVNREKELKGPFLILWRDSAEAPWALGRVSPDLIRQLEHEKRKDPRSFNPMSAPDVRMVACGTRGARVKVGEYTITGKAEKQPAFGYDIDIRVVEWPSRKPIAQWTERVEPLQFKNERDSNVANASATNVAIVISVKMP